MFVGQFWHETLLNVTVWQVIVIPQTVKIVTVQWLKANYDRQKEWKGRTFLFQTWSISPIITLAINCALKASVYALCLLVGLILSAVAR